MILLIVRMYDYVTKELPALVSGLFPVDPLRMAISGHSMGGHGAMVAHLKNPGKYASVSGNTTLLTPHRAHTSSSIQLVVADSRV